MGEASDIPMEMPAFRDRETGHMMIWDPTSHTYVVAGSEGHNRPDRSHATGGDNDLFDPAVHSEQPKNPMAEGILASSWMHNANARPCPNCGGLVDPDGRCTACGYKQFDQRIEQESPQQQHNLGPFPDRVPKESPLRVDNSFPTMSSRKASARTDVRNDMSHSFAHILEERQHLATQPDLDGCPKCQAPMVDKAGETICHDCGHKQPVIQVESREQRIARVAYLLPHIKVN